MPITHFVISWIWRPENLIALMKGKFSKHMTCFQEKYNIITLIYLMDNIIYIWDFDRCR